MPISLPDAWEPMAEGDVLKYVLDNSPEFRAYYQGERGKITYPIAWVRDRNLPIGIDFRVSRIQSGTEFQDFVRLRTVPARLEDSFSVAHELNHFIMRADGYPTLGAPAGTGLETLASSISSMIHDPIVNSRLIPYGFDVRADYEAEVDTDLRHLAVVPAPSKTLDRLHWVVNFAAKTLDRELAGVPFEEDRLETFIKAQCPHLIAPRDSLLRTIRRIGYDTPLQQQRLFTEIIRRYKLPAAIHIAQL